MKDEIPDDFEWPDPIQGGESEIDHPPLVSGVFQEGFDAGIYPETKPLSFASHSQSEEIEIRPLAETTTETRLPFSPQNPQFDGSQWSVEVYPGWVISDDPTAAHNSGSGISEFMPEIGGQPLNELVDGEYPRIDVSVGDIVCARIQRDEKGILQEPVVIIVSSDDSDYYAPPDEDGLGGNNENYQFRKLFEVLDDPDAPGDNIIFKPYQQSDIELKPFIWEGKNLGIGSRHWKRYFKTENVQEFRSTHGIYGIEDVEEAEEITLAFDAENIGARGSNVYVPREDTEDKDPPVDKAEFKKIAELESDPQIRVEEIDDYIQVRGNNNYVDIIIAAESSGADFTLADIRDGLVKASQDLAWFECEVCIPAEVAYDPPTLTTKNIVIIP